MNHTQTIVPISQQEACKKAKLSIAAAKIHTVKCKISDLKDLDLFPASQLKDITNTLDNLIRKAQVKIEKEERIARITGTSIEKVEEN